MVRNCASVLRRLGRLSPGQGCPGGLGDQDLALWLQSGVSSYFPCPNNGTVGGLAPKFLQVGAWQWGGNRGGNLALGEMCFPSRKQAELHFAQSSFQLFQSPEFATSDQRL